MAQRKSIDCRKMEGNCSVKISGTEEELMPLAVHHATTKHGHEDTPELRDELRSMMKDEAE